MINDNVLMLIDRYYSYFKTSEYNYVDEYGSNTYVTHILFAYKCTVELNYYYSNICTLIVSCLLIFYSIYLQISTEV